MGLVSPVQNDATNASTNRVQSLGKDEFLKLLITKLQNQDPLKPMDDESFIAQLAQFSTLEQMNNISEGIAEANQWDFLQMQSLNNAMAANLVGKDVRATYDRVFLDGDNSPNISYTIPSYASDVKLTIKDANGNIVTTLVDNDVKPGTHSVEWDGKDDLGNRVVEGLYSVEAVARDAAGETFTPDLLLEGTVQAVVYRNGSAYLSVDGVEISLGDITAIGEPGAFSDGG